MRAPLVFSIAVIFHPIFVTSGSGEDHELQNSTTRDGECKEDRIKLLLDRISMTPVTLDEGDDYERGGWVYPSRMKRRTTYRSRTKPKARSRNLPKSGNRTEDKSRRTDRVPPVVRILNQTNLYEMVNASFWNNTNKIGNTQQINKDESLNYSFHQEWEPLLTRLSETLENNFRQADTDTSSAIDDEDRCQKWLDNWENIEKAFPGSVADLPACPCLYPNSIFYDNQIWDNKRERKFRWRDVSHKDRLEIYKPSALYCVQTLPSQDNESTIVQHCCYDKNRKLLTRGSGAGTPYIVSPEISSLLHDKIDLLPWRLCKGDFTRYNEVRKPNNDKNCEINPDNKEYQRQVENAKNY